MVVPYMLVDDLWLIQEGKRNTPSHQANSSSATNHRNAHCELLYSRLSINQRRCQVYCGLDREIGPIDQWRPLIPRQVARDLFFNDSFKGLGNLHPLISKLFQDGPNYAFPLRLKGISYGAANGPLSRRMNAIDETGDRIALTSPCGIAMRSI